MQVLVFRIQWNDENNRKQQVLRGWRKGKTWIFKIMDRSCYKKKGLVTLEAFKFLWFSTQQKYPAICCTMWTIFKKKQ